MAGVITRGSTPKLLWPGLNAIWGAAYNEYQAEWKKMFEINTSDKAYEEDVGLTNMGLAPIKPEGSSIQYDTMKQNWVQRYTNIAYALGFIITREEIEDVLYAKFGADRARALAFSMNQTKENVGANIFNRAFNNSYVGGAHSLWEFIGVAQAKKRLILRGNIYDKVVVPGNPPEKGYSGNGEVSEFEVFDIDESFITTEWGIRVDVHYETLGILTDYLETDDL